MACVKASVCARKAVALLCVVAGLAAGCTLKDKSSGPTVQIDGSSTVFPITQAVAEEFQKERPGVKIPVGTSGTGGGFKQFVRGELDINNASRPISDEERAQAEDNGIKYVELRVAIDGLSVVVHPGNDWVECISIQQLSELWKPGSTVTRWNELDPAWPNEPFRLYGADTDSGTFDYFTEAVNGKAKASRSDYTPSADDNVLVRGVSGDRYSLGYFGYAYYVENEKKLKVLAVSDESTGGECIKPTAASIADGTYTPLSRPLFLYVNVKSLQRPEVRDFIDYFLSHGQQYVEEVGYIPVPLEMMTENRAALDAATGSGGGN